jgi:hypothetical protein
LAVDINKMNQLFDDQHISQENLLRYVEDDCSRLEMRAIDRHLATCPMCSDAVEGLMLLSEPSVAVDNLNKKIDEKVAEKMGKKPIGTPIKEPVFEVVKRPFWQQTWAAAAAVLMLASASIWFFRNAQNIENKQVTSSEIAVTNDSVSNAPPQYAAAETAKEAPISLKETPSKTASTGADLAQPRESQSGVLKNDINKKTNIEKPQTAQSRSPTIAVADKKEMVLEKETAAPVETATQTDRTRDYAGASAQNSVQRQAMSASADSVAPSKMKAEEADAKYNEMAQSRAPKPAAKASKAKTPAADSYKINPSVSTSSEQTLNNADDFFKQKYYATAATEYTKFVNLETSGDRHNRALFQLATCYAKLNKKTEAKILFEKLSVLDGPFGQAAKKALKDL